MKQRKTVWKLFDLTGRVFLVAGGARNLGKDMVEALAEAGADGALTSRNKASAKNTAAKISRETGKNIIGYQLDATKESEVKNTIKKVVNVFGKIDILVNCVGGGAIVRKSEPVNLENRLIHDWYRIQNTNVTAPFLLCKYLAPIMIKQRSGVIINIASIAGIVGRDRSVYVDGMMPQTIDYSAAKGAVISMTRDLAAYLGPYGIRVNCISPGGFERGQPKGFIKTYSERCILGRMGEDGVDLKGAVVYLASDASAYVTGHNLVVDGGFTIWR